MIQKIDLEKILNHGELIEEKEMIFGINEKKAFIQLSKNQFENPLDGIRELIANAVDSYIGLNKDVVVEIESKEDIKGESMFTIKDYGSGMNDKKIILLRTLGLSDKSECSIGRFGIGFASIFNPELKVKEVIVDTNNDGKYYQFIFNAKKDSIPSMKIYNIGSPIDFGTKITLLSKSSYQIEGILGKAFEECSFMPHKVIINGKEISKKSLTADKSKGIDIDEDGMKGYIEIPDYKEGVRLLSKYIPIEKKDFKDFFNHYLGELIIHNISGVINNDSFNLVVSRNQIIEDIEFRKLKNIISSKGTGLLSKLVDYHRETKKDYYKDIILENMVNFCFKNDIVKEYLIEKKDVRDFSLFERSMPRNEEYKDSVDLLEKIVCAELFELWDGGLISLKNMRERIGNKGLILIIDKEEIAGSIDERGSRNILIKKDYILKDDKNILPSLYKQRPFIDVSEENIKDLVLFGKVKLKQIDNMQKEVKYETLSNQEKSFLSQVKKVLKIKEIKGTYTKYGFPDNISVVYTQSKKDIIASYNNTMNKIFLNRDNRFVKGFINSKNHKQNVFYFIPVLSHEITHDKVPNHLHGFYRHNLTLDTEMRGAIARYLSK